MDTPTEIDAAIGIVVTKTETPQTYATVSTGITVAWPGGITVLFPWTEDTLQRQTVPKPTNDTPA